MLGLIIGNVTQVPSPKPPPSANMHIARIPSLVMALKVGQPRSLSLSEVTQS